MRAAASSRRSELGVQSGGLARSAPEAGTAQRRTDSERRGVQRKAPVSLPLRWGGSLKQRIRKSKHGTEPVNLIPNSYHCFYT
ncbi:hypothetical protein VTJ04DRAFT_8770 [Mycothermus thermophilus]|uniref:uncharacterized protein n=1 Tax=Humicola insolens TaxID=85995 RepID=UPI003742AD5D